MTDLQKTLAIRVEAWPFIFLPSALIVDRSLPDGAKVTYAFLSLWGGRDGEAYPARQVLVDARNVSLSGLRSHLQQLEEKGWIRRSGGVKGGKRLTKVLVFRSPGGRQPSGVRQPVGGSTASQLAPTPHLNDGKRTKEREYPPTPQPIAVDGRRPGWLGELAAHLQARYPHPPDGAGTVRPPSLPAVEGWLADLVRKGRSPDPEAVMTAVEAERAALGREGADPRFQVRLKRWVAEEAWLSPPQAGEEIDFDAEVKKTRAEVEKRGRLDDQAEAEREAERRRHPGRKASPGTLTGDIAQVTHDFGLEEG